MTGQVDMDALRDKAWDEYTTAGHTEGLLFGMDKSPREAFLVGFAAAADELDRLRKANSALKSALDTVLRRDEHRRDIIADAPHAPGCSWYNTAVGLSCNCWKADAP